jgi:hypothetical protein
MGEVLRRALGALIRVVVLGKFDAVEKLNKACFAVIQSFHFALDHKLTTTTLSVDRQLAVLL